MPVLISGLTLIWGCQPKPKVLATVPLTWRSEARISGVFVVMLKTGVVPNWKVPVLTNAMLLGLSLADVHLAAGDHQDAAGIDLQVPLPRKAAAVVERDAVDRVVADQRHSGGAIQGDVARGSDLPVEAGRLQERGAVVDDEIARNRDRTDRAGRGQRALVDVGGAGVGLRERRGEVEGVIGVRGGDGGGVGRGINRCCPESVIVLPLMPRIVVLLRMPGPRTDMPMPRREMAEHRPGSSYSRWSAVPWPAPDHRQEETEPVAASPTNCAWQRRAEVQRGGRRRGP